MTVLDKICKILSTIGCANRLIRILTALRIAVFAGAFLYTGVMFVSLLRHNIRMYN